MTLQNPIQWMLLQDLCKPTYQKVQIFLFYLLTLHIPKYKDKLICSNSIFREISESKSFKNEVSFVVE